MAGFLSIPPSLKLLLDNIGISNLEEFTSTYSISITPTRTQEIKSTFQPVEKYCEKIIPEVEVEEESEEVKEAILTRSYSRGSPYALAQGKYACCAYMSNNKISISIFRRLINNPGCEQLLQTKYDITQQPVIDFLNWWVSVDIIITVLKDCSKDKIRLFVEGMIELYITTDFYKSSSYAESNPFTNAAIKESCIFYLELIIFIFYLTWTKFKPLKCLTIRTRTFILESSSQYQLLLQLFTLKHIGIGSLVEGFDCPDMVGDIIFFLNKIKKCTPTNIVCCPFNIKYDFDEGCFVIIFWDYTSDFTVKAYITVDDVLQIVDYCVKDQGTYVDFATELNNFEPFEHTGDPTVHSVNIKEFNITTSRAGIGNSWGIHNPYFYIQLLLTILTTIDKGIRMRNPQHLELNGVFIIYTSAHIPEIYRKIIGLSQQSLDQQKEYATRGIIEKLGQLQALQAEAERRRQAEAEAERLQQAEAKRLQEEAEEARQRQEEAESERLRQAEAESIPQRQEEEAKARHRTKRPNTYDSINGNKKQRGGSKSKKSKKIRKRKTIKRRKRRTKRKH